MSRKHKTALAILIIVFVFIPSAITLCVEIQDKVVQPGGLVSMPDALVILGVLSTIIVALIRYVPMKNSSKQPINITVTWPDKIPTHDHPECVKTEYCALARDSLQRELNDIKRNQS
jgi:hypothetical protein